MWKRLWKKATGKVKGFFRYIWSECKDWRTVVLLALVVAVVYSPAWGGYVLGFLFKWKWCLAASTAYAAFWAGPFTPFFPLCITITFALKKLMRMIVKRRADGETAAISANEGDARQPKNPAPGVKAGGAPLLRRGKKTRRERKRQKAGELAALRPTNRAEKRKARALRRISRAKKAVRIVPPVLLTECDGSGA